MEAVESCFFCDHSIIIQDVADGTSSLMHYKLDGTYVGTVGKFGLGEGSYAHASSVLLDEANDRVSVYDMMIKRQCVTYRLSDGTLLGSTPMKKLLPSYTRALYPLTKDSYLGYTSCGNHRLCYFITDPAFAQVDTLLCHPARFPFGTVNFATHPVTGYKGSYSMLAPFSDTIYTLRDRTLRPRLVCRTHPSVPTGYRPTTDDYFTQLTKLDKQGYSRKEGLYETDHWLVVADKKGLLFYNKATGKGGYMKKDISLRGDLIYPLDLWSESDGRLIAVYTPEELLAIKRAMEAARLPLSAKMQALFARLRPGMPPVLLFYTLT